MTGRVVCCRFLCALAALSAGCEAVAQNLINEPVDATRRVRIKGSLNPQAEARYDLGPVESSFRLGSIRMMLRQTDSQRAELDRLLADQQDPASPRYHKWLTPEQYADRFGASQSDIDRISAWLISEGFTVDYTARGRDWITFSGTAGQVEAAFQTVVHRYDVQGEKHYSVSSEPSVPAALEPLLAGFFGLDDFVPKSHSRLKPGLTPRSGDHSLAPDDIATIYSFNRLYQAGINGAGQKIVIVGQTAIDPADIGNFRATYGLAASTIQVIQTGNNPGFNDALEEADLDLEWAGAIARNASLIYVYSTNADGAAAYAIDQNLAPVISESFGSCEANLSSSSGQTHETQAKKGNAEGITWLASSGDSGAAGCDNGVNTASHGLAVSFPASIPEVSAVGGTEFNEGTGDYWSAANGASGGSALSWIPEMAWNDTSHGGGIASTGGGVSTLFAKPAWQAGPGVPNDNSRDVPDISMAAANGHDPYNIYTSGQWVRIGGTSASAPVFAGLVALLNQYLNSGGSGNINTSLYRLAQSAPGIFHDVVAGTNMVPCALGTPGCVNGSFGYSAGPGYDLATGLGSVDAYNLVTGWNGPPTPTITGLSPATTTAGGPAFRLTVNGTNFASSATVQWNGTALATIFVNASQLQATVTGGLIATTGVVQVTVSNVGKMSGSAIFTILAASPQITFTSQRVTTQAPPGSGCVVPPAVTSFLTTDNLAYLYFSAVVSASDLLSADWLAPDGTVVKGTSWAQATGNFCLTGSVLPLAVLAGGKLGAWQARVYDNGVQLFSVAFSVSAPAAAAPLISLVRNAASYASGTVSPGEIVLITGTGLGPAQLATITFTNAGLASTQLGGTSVQFNGLAAPLIYASATAVAAIVPYGVGGTTAQVNVTYVNKVSAAVFIPLASSAPGVFTANASGSGPAAALNQDGTLNTTFQPAVPGSVIVLFATGEGQTQPGGVDGRPAGVPYPHPVLPVTVSIGGVNANVAYAGAVPGEIAGIMQLNAVIPAGVSGLAVPVIVKIGSAQSQAATTIAVGN